MGSDKRRLAFKILHSTAEDLKKLERCAEGDECRFLIYVLEEEEQTVYGFAITAKNPRTLNVWRRILSAKTQDKIRDFRQDEAMDEYDQAYYEDFGEVHVKGQYTSQGSRTDCARNADKLARVVKALMAGETTLSELSEEHPLVYFKNKKVLVEYGAGYYVERSCKDAQGFFDRKVKFLSERTSQLEQTIRTKREQLAQVIQIYQAKVKMQAEANAQQAGNA